MYLNTYVMGRRQLQIVLLLQCGDRLPKVDPRPVEAQHIMRFNRLPPNVMVYDELG